MYFPRHTVAHCTIFYIVNVQLCNCNSRGKYKLEQILYLLRFCRPKQYFEYSTLVSSSRTINLESKVLYLLWQTIFVEIKVQVATPLDVNGNNTPSYGQSCVISPCSCDHISWQQKYLMTKIDNKVQINAS